MKVEFIDVGRDKERWIVEIQIDNEGMLDRDAMVRSVRRTLVSRDINFLADGNILVGTWRSVRFWRVIEDTQEK